MSDTEFDVNAALKNLKDFQRRTVDYAFRRMYLDPSPTHRFLIADEVGLGKTLVARGIIARAVDHLQRAGVKRVDVLYICSNASIAQQNLRKLNVSQQDTSEFATRLTLLPTQLKNFKKSGVNFISFTPGTTFDLKSRGGRIDERAIIYQMLVKRLEIAPKLLFRLLQGNAGTSSWTYWAKGRPTDYDLELADGFATALRADGPFMQRLHEVCAKLQGVRRVSAELGRELSEIVGELRRRLADVCVDALEPDLVVLDEFQRFKDLLHADAENDAATLARRLFEYESKQGNVRVLLLSATPYRMLSMDHEGHDDHYSDFLETLRFLFSGNDLQVLAVREGFRQFRQALYGLEPDADARAIEARDRLEELLRSVIARTERVDMTAGRNAMLVERSATTKLEKADLLAARFAERIAGCVDAGDIIEYWKSCPYLVNFMGDYELKRKLLEKCGKAGEAQVHAAVTAANGELLRNSVVQRYGEINPSNPRMRALLADTVDGGQWKWLWLPPALPYLRPAGAYADATSSASTKALVFSNWQIVPKAIAALCSYDAERRMLGGLTGVAAGATGPAAPLPRYKYLHKERRPLLRFSIERSEQERRPTGMPVLALLYPCATLAAVVDPLRLGIEIGKGSESVQQADALKITRERIAAKLAAVSTASSEGSRVDERWYWAAPVLLDRHFAEEAISWLKDSKGFGDALAEDGEPLGRAARRHLNLLAQAAEGKLKLGPQPTDLAEVMAEMALGGPGICAMRAMQRIAHDLPETSFSMMSAAVRIATGLRTLFNQPDVVSMLQDAVGGELGTSTPYWRRVLQYSIDGNLQAVLDEYCHVLRDAEGLAERPGSEVAGELAKVVHSALTLRTATVDVDDLRAMPSGSVRRKVFRIRSRVAVRFGDVKDDQGKTLARSGGVRHAFNSPFRPFILASTSVGQEGLDFHPYCHAVYHWNLPANPVDLEQREGRVHRFKGHAVRRNLATTYGLSALRRMRGWNDPWDALFSLAAADRPAGTSELMPYWLFEPGGHAVERRVPLIPMSREIAQLRRLKQMLAVYRLAFGQPRQEELICYLTGKSEALQTSSADLRLKLTPR